MRLSANDTYHWKQGSNNTIVAAAEFKVYGKIELDAAAFIKSTYRTYIRKR